MEPVFVLDWQAAQPVLSQTWLEGRLAFAGAEASQGHGGLIEGALEAADAAMERLFPASA